MRTRLLFMLLLAGWAWGVVQAVTDEGRYIEVTGTSEVEIVPDEIHYIIEIKEYFAEEFDHWHIVRMSNPATRESRACGQGKPTKILSDSREFCPIQKERKTWSCLSFG